MSSDLIALGVAIALGIAVVVLGLRRNLSDSTRNGLPSFGGEPEQATPNLGLFKGEAVRQRHLSPRRRRWFAAFYLFLALTDAVFAAVSAHDRLLHASTAGIWALGAGFVLWQGYRQSSDRSVSPSAWSG